MSVAPVRVWLPIVAIGDTKSPIEESGAETFAHLCARAADLGGLIAGIKSGEIE